MNKTIVDKRNISITLHKRKMRRTEKMKGEDEE